jgi:hypothetical protein
MFDNTKPIFPRTFSHLRQEGSTSARQHTYSPVINTQAFKNICDQKGLGFLSSLKRQEDLRARARGRWGELERMRERGEEGRGGERKGGEGRGEEEEKEGERKQEGGNKEDRFIK